MPGKVRGNTSLLPLLGFDKIDEMIIIFEASVGSVGGSQRPGRAG